MSDKINELADDLYDIWCELQKLKEKERVLKDQLIKFFLKDGTERIIGPEFEITLHTRKEYQIPSPEELRRELGDAIASKYIKEVVDKSAKNDCPPQLVDRLFPLLSDTRYLTVKPKE